ncbi:glutathione S-transferase family protein [Paraliomyxa miuraensis]|uniref:glutathione S-transferase family protein n=1 Tax=Paraliomyxa miuraensis TaxID=376150 RepID=UPI00225B037C|nr:glutathione S-transferase family protein [Paraliomyxa miuraensis]MCX4244169.1 glutathione S-transferase family protein [Paraliomyxa miuraensis]
MSDSQPKMILWQTVPCWGAPSTSPFCIKLETWLRMAKIPYQARVLNRPPRSATGKVPYIERSDGSLLADSGAIIEALTAEHGVTLDEGLDARSQALQTAVTRMLEDHFYWVIAWDRWIIDAHWAQTRVAYFGALPWPMSTLVPAVLRGPMRRALHGQGFGRLTSEAILERTRRDLAALAELVGDGTAVLDRRSSVDAIAYAFLVAARCPPWNGPLQQAVAARPNLMAYCEAIERDYW